MAIGFRDLSEYANGSKCRGCNQKLSTGERFLSIDGIWFCLTCTDSLLDMIIEENNNATSPVLPGM